jgi:polyisoprenyl-phosphate glycosyltransferase
MPSISVLIPVYNNASTIRELFDRLCVALQPVTDHFEIIMINDGSADESWKVICEITRADPRGVGVCLSRNFGQHPAINAGLARARGQLTVLMDADLQDRPEELPALVTRFEANPDLDIVYTKFVMNDGERSRFTSRLFHSLYARVTGLDIPQNLGTYRVFTARVREALLDYPERAAVYGPLMAQMGFEFEYATVARAEAVGRKTSYTFSKRLSLAISSLVSYSAFLHRLVTWAGLILTTLSTIFLTVLVIQYATGFRVLLNGQLLLIGITVLTSGVLLMTVGVLTAYTFRIFQEVLARPRYHVSREVGSGLAESDTR